MRTTRRIAVAIAAPVILASQGAWSAEFGYFDARSVSMGNTGVASGNLGAGGYYNPALLAAQESAEDFAMLLPAVGGRLGDPNDLLDDIDQFQVAYDAGDTVAMQNALTSATGKSMIANGGAGTAMGWAGDNYAGGVIVNGYTINSLQVEPDTVTPSNSVLRTVGIQVLEIGIPLATKTQAGGQGYAFGITPKYVKIKTNDAAETLGTTDASIDGFLDNPANQTEEGAFNVDMGMAVGIGHGWRAGIVGRNLVGQELTTTTGKIIHLEPQFRAGVAYANNWVTVAIDADLNENKPVGFEDPSQMVGLGIEFDVFDVLQIRGGYMYNLKAADNIDQPGSYTLGLGLNIGPVNIDAAAMSNGNDNDLGAYMQLGLHW